MRAPLLLALFCLPACTLAGEPGDGSDGTGMPGDAAAPTSAADAADGCTPIELGTAVAASDMSAYSGPWDPADPDGNQIWLMRGSLDPAIWLQLHVLEGYGAFATSDVAVGDYTIAGIDTNWLECGLCALVCLEESGGERCLNTTSGVISLDSIEGRFVGAASNLTFAETLDGLPVAGTCGLNIASLEFDLPLQPY